MAMFSRFSIFSSVAKRLILTNQASVNAFRCIGGLGKPFLRSNHHQAPFRDHVNFVGEFGNHFTQSQCKVCGMKINNTNNLVQHLLSPKHAQNMILLLDVPNHKNVTQQQPSDATNRISETDDKYNNNSNTRAENVSTHGHAFDHAIADNTNTNNNGGLLPSYTANRVNLKRLESIARNKEGNISESNKRGSLNSLGRSSDTRINRLRDKITFRCSNIESIYKVLNDNRETCDSTVYACAIQKCSERLWWKDCLRIFKMGLENIKQPNLRVFSILFRCMTFQQEWRIAP